MIMKDFSQICWIQALKVNIGTLDWSQAASAAAKEVVEQSSHQPE